MIAQTEQLRALDLRWERRAYYDMSFHEALARFTALWTEARVLREDPGTQWRVDLASDLAIARAVNDPPPS